MTVYGYKFPQSPTSVQRYKCTLSTFKVDDNMTSSMLYSEQNCVVKVRYIDEEITSWLHTFCDFDCKLSCISTISEDIAVSGLSGN